MTVASLARNPWASAVGAALLATAPPALLLLVLDRSIGLPPQAGPIFPKALSIPGLLVLAPVLETFTMVPVIALASKITKSVPLAIVLSALAIGLFHLLPPPPLPVVRLVAVTWAFSVFGALYVYWQQRRPRSFLRIVMLAHCLANVPAGIATLLS